MNEKIIVVDDDEGILESFHALLESEGYTVITICSGRLLKELIKKESPDLILLDVLLSGEDGRKICKELKGHKATKNIPIIMISAHPSAAKTIHEVGADAYLEKPFEMDDLLSLIYKYTKSSQDKKLLEKL